MTQDFHSTDFTVCLIYVKTKKIHLYCTTYNTHLLPKCFLNYSVLLYSCVIPDTITRCPKVNKSNLFLLQMLPLHHDYNLHSFVSIICSHAQFIGSLTCHWLSYLWLTFPHLHLCFTTPNLLKTFWNKNRVQGVVILIWYSQRLEWWRKEILKLDKQDCISPITCLSPAYFIV